MIIFCFKHNSVLSFINHLNNEFLETNITLLSILFKKD